MQYLIKEDSPEKLYYITATEEDRCAGTLTFEVEDNILHIKKIYVEEEFRQQGVGSGLVKKAAEYLRSHILDGITFLAPVEKRRKLIVEKFLIKNGFQMPEYDSLLITVDIDRLKSSYIGKIANHFENPPGKIHELDRLSMSLRTFYESYVKHKVEQEYFVENVPGRMIPELSLALEQEKQISSYVVFSEMDNELYLNAIYVDSKNSSGLLYLLAYCFQKITENYSQNKVFKIKIVNYEGYKLFKKLLSGAETAYEVVLAAYGYF